jgi:hypothetical protein
MGKVKAWAEAEFEKSLAKKEKQAGFGVGNPRHRGMVDSDWAQMVGSEEAWAQFDKEFCAWLDAYEASFGDNYGK